MKFTSNISNSKKNMMRKFTFLQGAFSLLVGILFAFQGFAQGLTNSTINGLVTDAKGEALPGATVVAVHVPSGTKYGTVTNISGNYVFPAVRVGGPYKITVTFVGYKETIKEGVIANLGSPANVNVKLSEEGTQLDEVAVRSTRSSIFSSDRTGAATGVVKEQIQALPTISRSFNDITRLTPQGSSNTFNGAPSFGGRSSNFNNITVDGAAFNNSFGLSGAVGGQTNAQPISLDAIEQISVNIAPYDVREGSFTGAGVNMVTKSGDNEFRGSIYNFGRNLNYVGKKVLGESAPLDPVAQKFSVRNTGFRVGGPIIKDKVFFFLSAEQERRDDPGSTFSAKGSDLGGNQSNVLKSDLDKLSDFLITKYNYNPGPYEGYKLKSNSDKLNARIDINISNNHKFALKYNFLQSFRDTPASSSGSLSGGRAPSLNVLPFLSSFYRINNNLNSLIGELNSTFGGKIANKFQIGYTGFRDFRETPLGNTTPFPTVDIGNGLGQAYTAFGYEPFSANNILNTDVYQISDNVDIFKGKHNFSIGTYNEFYSFKNGFAPNYYGGYQFKSLDDFYASANNGTSNALQYRIQYSALASGEFPFAYIKAAQYGLYAQDKFQVSNKFSLTYGLRVDIPVINADIQENTAAAALTFRDGIKINTSQVQKSQLLWSPRVGFNYDVTGDKKVQVRGGTGIFTGKVPFVWVSNQASNNGVLFGSSSVNNPTDRPFSADVNAYRPVGAAANASYNLAVTDNNFKFPQIWRTNLAVDVQLPAGLVATVEGAYTKDLNAVYHQNVNLPNSVGTAAGADNRPIFYNIDPTTGKTTTVNRINSNISDAILMKNTNQGYSYFLTAKLEKSFSNHFYASAAYTHSDAKSVNDGGSIAQSIWRDRSISGDPNAVALANSNYLVKDRFIVGLTYSFEYIKLAKTTIGLFYEYQSGNPYSYTYSGDMNGDGSGGSGNDLIFVPKDASQIKLVDIKSGSNVVFSAADQWTALDKFINQDPYLSTIRGKYAERNGAFTPSRGQLDLSIKQDLFTNIGKKRNTIQVSFDIFNFGNMLNSKWGVYRGVSRTALLTYAGYDKDRNPLFTFPYATGTTPLTSTFFDSKGIGSRWQAQLGLRYIFN